MEQELVLMLCLQMKSGGTDLMWFKKHTRNFAINV